MLFQLILSYFWTFLKVSRGRTFTNWSIQSNQS